MKTLTNFPDDYGHGSETLEVSLTLVVSAVELSPYNLESKLEPCPIIFVFSATQQGDKQVIM